MEAKRWEWDEGEMWLLSAFASLDVTGDQFLSELVVVPRLGVGRDFAGEGAEGGTPAVGVDGIADFGELVGVAGVAEDLENGDVNGKQSFGGIAGVALLLEEKAGGAFGFAGMALMRLLELGHEFVSGFGAGSQKKGVFCLGGGSPDFERFADCLVTYFRAPVDVTFHSVFGAAHVAEFGGSIAQSGQVKFCGAGKLRRVICPAVGGRQRLIMCWRGAEHGREVRMITGEITLGRAVVRHGYIQGTAMSAIIR